MGVVLSQRLVEEDLTLHSVTGIGRHHRYMSRQRGVYKLISIYLSIYQNEAKLDYARLISHVSGVWITGSG